ncbi:hypothetical protein [Actinoplanes cyaneus]|nr:hypothetical protein [Actinoplanes cyaneus]MCW2138270.1 hypothetical protein [Actinoplanes cyaneus]
MSEPHPQEPLWSRPGGPWSSGAVTGVPPLTPPPPAPEPPKRVDPGQQRRRQLMIFGGAAGVILAGGLIVLLVLLFGSDGNPFGDRASAPTDVRPPLAQACPPPSDSPSGAATRAPAPPAVTGDRTVDEQAGISYKKYGAPWLTWNEVWKAGTLQVPYRVGQHFVTELYSGGEYHASILSAAVPAADNDAVSLDLECVGRQVAADVRANYYPQPNTLDVLRDEVTTLGGRPAYVNKFRLHFHEAGLTATSELSAVAVIDVGKPMAAVLYISIPGTHQQLDAVIDEVLESVRPI